MNYDNMILWDTARKLSSILNENTVFEPILSKITVYRIQLLPSCLAHVFDTAFLLSIIHIFVNTYNMFNHGYYTIYCIYGIFVKESKNSL